MLETKYPFLTNLVSFFQFGIPCQCTHILLKNITPKEKIVEHLSPPLLVPSVMVEIITVCHTLVYQNEIEIIPIRVPSFVTPENTCYYQELVETASTDKRRIWFFGNRPTLLDLATAVEQRRRVSTYYHHGDYRKDEIIRISKCELGKSFFWIPKEEKIIHLN